MFSSRMGFESVVTTTPLVGNQYITTFVTGGVDNGTPSSTGYAYVGINGTLGIGQIDSNGNVIFQNTSNVGYPTYNTLCVDSSGNILVGGLDDSAGSMPGLIKYSSNGSILWQKGFSNTTPSLQVNSITTDNTNNVFVLYGYFPGSYIPTTIAKYNGANGALINQRALLKSSTTTVTGLYFDSTNSTIVVTGTDYANSSSAIYNGIYDLTNTSNASIVLTQTSNTTPGYSTLTGNNKLCSDSTNLYQIATRVVSGITYYVYMAINKSSGSILYSNTLTYSSTILTLTGISVDNSGYIYVTGYSNALMVFAKINASTGSLVWQKSLVSTASGAYNNVSGTIYWMNNFVYVSGSYTTPSPVTVHTYTCKLKDDGSTSNGTYGTYTLSTVSGTTTARNSFATSTTTDSPSTTSYATNTPTIGLVTSTYTTTTTTIP